MKFCWQPSKIALQYTPSQQTLYNVKASVNAGIAQLVERNLAKVEVESSRLFSRSNFQKKGSVSFPFLSEESDFLAR
jgi:hypothetical protein